MKEILNILLEFIICYILIFFLYYLFFIRKKTKYNRDRVPVEFQYLISVYHLKQKEINYKKFLYQSAFINSFIISITYTIITRLLNKLIWQVICGIIIIILLIIICYGILGRYYQKRGKKNV